MNPGADATFEIVEATLAAHKEELASSFGVSEIGVFGSVASGTANEKSDVDVLVTFHPDARWSLFDFVDMQEELKALFGRDVDLVETEGLRNPFRRRSILRSREVIHAAG